MNLGGTQTLINLARSFAGESQARGRYHFYAEKLKSEGHEALYRTVTEIENNELAHAKVFLNYITDNPSFGYDNIDIDGGYPYKLGNIVSNLNDAAKGENDESTIIYPRFAEIAREEGFAEIAATYEMIAKVEAEHEKIFTKMKEHLEKGTLYNRAEPIKWKCENCGFEYSAEKAFELCPLCKHPIGYMRSEL
ncbi:MAG: rubrerythrin family protein [Oscillospiraceae bacterium]|nr:rubrerythrin family protein [Oscillospiraceae bacterium]